MVPPGFAADGCADDEHDDYTSGQYADDDVEAFVAMDQRTGALLFLDKLLFYFNAPFFFYGYMAKQSFGVGCEQQCEEHDAEKMFSWSNVDTKNAGVIRLVLTLQV